MKNMRDFIVFAAFLNLILSLGAGGYSPFIMLLALVFVGLFVAVYLELQDINNTLKNLENKDTEKMDRDDSIH